MHLEQPFVKIQWVHRWILKLNLMLYLLIKIQL